MDEIGFVVRYITPDGFLLLDTAQGARRDGPPQRFMVGQDAVVFGRSGPVAEGVFAASSGHVAGGAAELDWSNLWIELGLESREEVERLGVYVGSPVVFGGSARQVGRRLVGKALDDRVALVVLDLLLERLDPDALGCRVALAATVHEEGGLHGAYALAATQRFDLAVVLEIGLVGDIPSVPETEYQAKLGGGPILAHKDGQISYHHALTWTLADAAAAADVPVQHAIWANANTDGVPLLRAGIPTALVGVPTRYTHTAFETCAASDIVDTTRMLEALVTQTDLSPWNPR